MAQKIHKNPLKTKQLKKSLKNAKYVKKLAKSADLAKKMANFAFLIHFFNFLKLFKTLLLSAVFVEFLRHLKVKSIFSE